MQQQLIVGEGIICGFGGGWITKCPPAVVKRLQWILTTLSFLYSLHVSLLTVLFDTRQSMVTAIPPPPPSHSR